MYSAVRAVETGRGDVSWHAAELFKEGGGRGVCAVEEAVYEGFRGELEEDIYIHVPDTFEHWD